MKVKDNEFCGIDMEDCEGNIFENNDIGHVKIENSHNNQFKNNTFNNGIKMKNSTAIINGKKVSNKK